MVAGDAWSEERGFELSAHDWFEHRASHLERYREEVKQKLEQAEEKEARATLTRQHLDRYFAKAFAAMPWPWRRLYKGAPILYVLSAGDRRWLFEVDFSEKRVREIDAFDDRTHPLQVHTSALVMKHCMAADLFTHLAISKRVRYRVAAEQKWRMLLLNLFFNFYEYEMLPLRRMASARFVTAWLPRWRELLLWARVATDLALRRGFHFPRYLPPPRSVPLEG
jgi:UDP-MurNAc hydroxylase